MFNAICSSAHCLLVFYFPSSYPLCPSMFVFKSFLPSFHSLFAPFSPPKLHLRYAHTTTKSPPHARAYGFAKVRRKCHIGKFIFPPSVLNPFSQGAGTVSPSSTQGVAKYFPSPSRLHGFANTLPNAWEGREKGGRNAWLVTGIKQVFISYMTRP